MASKKTAFAGPGEARDRKGVPVHPGDLLRHPHFTARLRRQRFFLYHTAVLRDGVLWMVPTCHLEPTLAGGGGTCPITAGRHDFEVIAGHGPPPHLDYTDRPRDDGKRYLVAVADRKDVVRYAITADAARKAGYLVPDREKGEPFPRKAALSVRNRLRRLLPEADVYLVPTDVEE
jgi:hypothetical protein